jgi:hypothetical protein
MNSLPGEHYRPTKQRDSASTRFKVSCKCETPRVSFFYGAVAQEPRFSGFSKAKLWKRPPVLGPAAVKHGELKINAAPRQWGLV